MPSQEVRFTIVVPKKTQAKRLPAYVSPSTFTATIVDTASSIFPISQTVVCEPNCSATLQSPIGQNTFSVTLADGPGTILSRGSLTTTIVANEVNNVSVTFNPVVKSVSLPYLSAAPGTAHSVTGTVVALDPDGNTIVGPGVFCDANGNPITIALADEDPTGHTSLTTQTISGPTDVVTLAYDGTKHTTALISGTASNGIAVSSGAFASMTTTTYPYAVSGAYVNQLTVGPDQAIWAMDSANVDHVVRVASDGAQTTFPLSSQAQVEGFTTGPDGNLWATLYGVNRSVARVTPAGVATYFMVQPLVFPHNIVPGPAGTLWFADRLNQSLDSVTATSGQTSIFPVHPPLTPSTVEPEDVAFGSDGNLYFTDIGNNAIDAFDTGSEAIATHYLPSGETPNGIVLGPGGYIWYTAYNNGEGIVGSIAPNGTMASYTVQIGSVIGIANGADGNLWWADQSFGLRWARPNGHSGAFPIPNFKAYILSFVEAPDGSFWASTTTGNAAAIIHFSF